MGRSIGSGPATLLAKNRAAGAFVLFSPLLSVYEVAKSIPSVGWAAGMFVSSNLFNNGEKIKSIHTPTFIIHGKRDEVVPHSHGEALHKNSPVPHTHKKFHSVHNMTHNNFRLYEDFINPCRDFLNEVGLNDTNPNLRPISADAFIQQYHEKKAQLVMKENTWGSLCTS